MPSKRTSATPQPARSRRRSGNAMGSEVDMHRAASFRTIWTMTRGVSDPARRARDDSDAREAGSLTPLSIPAPCLCRRPGRHKAPADGDASSGANVDSCEASQPGRLPRRRSTVHCHRLRPNGRRGRWPAPYCSPSSAPSLVNRPRHRRQPGEGEKRSPSARSELVRRSPRYDRSRAGRPDGAQ